MVKEFSTCDNELMKEYITSSIGQIDNAAAIDFLINTYNDENPNIRLAVINAFGTLKNEKTMQVIIQATTDQFVEVRERAAMILGNCKISDPREALTDIIKAEPINRNKADKRISAILGMMAPNDLKLDLPFEYEVRTEKVLRGSLKTKAKAALSNIVDDESLVVRFFAIKALCNISDSSMAAVFERKLKDSSFEVRAISAYALQITTDNTIVDKLLLSLNDESAFVRFMAGIALSRINDARTEDRLIEALNFNDPGKEENSVIMHALSNIASEKSKETFLQALTVEDFNIRYWALIGIERLGDLNNILPLLNSAYTYKKDQLFVVCVNDTISKFGPPALGTLKEIINNNDGQFRFLTILTYKLVCDNIRKDYFEDQMVQDGLKELINSEFLKEPWV